MRQIETEQIAHVHRLLSHINILTFIDMTYVRHAGTDISTPVDMASGVDTLSSQGAGRLGVGVALLPL
ncbi:hypothetical protein GORBP_083_00710 [Gordonia rubripertincta NBRC 101908]|uniref:Uncharacterized protein n=1 Tax=Gordonia rubripertincta NBRC 101908 TaxID=1077975 RepID=A0ABQ0HXB6_GORRU|nr:hypothetical protein GORBP_083_00710 [Gordonia rubripertincta NBRC 101908]